MEVQRINNPHDKFVKELLGRKENAVDFIQNYFPKEVVKYIDTENIDVEKDSFIEEGMTEYFSDILYKTKINDKTAYIYLLFEHKSYNERLISLQLLRYMLKIWDTKAKQNKSFPIVIPFLLHTGSEQWTVGLKLSDLLEEYPEELKKYVPDFEYLVTDLSSIHDDELFGRAMLKIGLMVMKHIWEDEMIEKLPEIFGLFRELTEQDSGLEFYRIVIRYIINSAKDRITLEKLKEIATKEISKERGDEVMSIGERLQMEGEKRGIINTAKNMFREGFEFAVIMKVTGLSEEELKRIENEI